MPQVNYQESITLVQQPLKLILMFGTIIAIAIIAALVYYIIGKFRKTETKELIEIESRDSLIRELDLRPGEFVKLVSKPERREVDVFSTRASGSRLGVIKNYSVFKKIVNGAAARIHSVNRDNILLQLVNPKDPEPVNP